MVNEEKIKTGAVIDLPVNPRVNEGTGWLPAEIVYIHPEKRFFMAEFVIEGHRIRECFCFHGPLAAWGGEK